ncbi:MAG: alkaline phosphatase family protein [Phycisphaerales bacterium]|nr:MAG: alkaline phosphatase family protein [Phycisphaerales bacterium]
MMKSQDRYSRVLILGMDGLDPKRVARMAHEGEFRAFSRPQKRGRLCPLATSNSAESPVAWSSLAIGCSPGKHGIFDFIHRDPRNYVPYLSLQRARPGLSGGKNRYVSPQQVPGFWRMTSDAGVPTTVIRWPVTFPAENVEGRFLAGLGVPDVTGRLGRYTYYTTAVDGKGDENVVPVAWRGKRIHTHLLGPAMTGISGSRPVRVRFGIERTDRGLTLGVGSQRYEIRPGQWSEWCTVQFKWGPIQVCDALVKFYLVSTNPELRLFATPLQIDPRRQVWPLTHPAAYGTELADRLGLFYTLGIPEDTNAVTDGRYDLDAFLQQCGEIDRERRQMFEHELNRFTDGVFAFVFDTSDRIQHMFWCAEDEGSPTYDPIRAKKYGGVIHKLYQDMDNVVAAALDAAGSDTAVLVVSDHGFASFHRSVHLNGWLIDNGFLRLEQPGEGRSLFGDVDWDHTRAYAVGFAGIYLNLAGRESNGIVKVGEQAEHILGQLVAGLLGARDPESAATMVRSVYLARDAYSGPHAADRPDLVVGFEPGHRASRQTALGGAPTNVVGDNDKLWTADHLVDPTAVPGVLATNVPVRIARPACVDLAPTVLACLGLPVPANTDGRSWVGDTSKEEVLPDNLDRLEPQLVGVAHNRAGPDGFDDQQRSQIEQHLSDLGYL